MILQCKNEHLFLKKDLVLLYLSLLFCILDLKLEIMSL